MTGRSTVHAELEHLLAEFEGAEAAILFSSGYAAGVGTIPALVGSDDVVFSDAKNHACLIDGCRLSRARIVVYPHRDLETLEQQLRQAGTCGRRLIVTDSLFSMDGDATPIAELSEARGVLRRDAACRRVAHATGVFGDRGRGVSDGIEGVHIRLGTLSKALGSAGGFVTGSRQLDRVAGQPCPELRLLDGTTGGHGRGRDGCSGDCESRNPTAAMSFSTGPENFANDSRPQAGTRPTPPVKSSQSSSGNQSGRWNWPIGCAKRD